MSDLAVNICGIVHQCQRSDRFSVAMKRQGVHMDGRIVDTQELAVAGIALGGLGGGARTKLEERSKARCYGERDPIRVVNSDALAMFAPAEAVHPALQLFVL